MTDSPPTVVALAGEARACANLAERLCGDTPADPDGPIFTMGAHRHRLAGGTAPDFLACLALDRARFGAAILVIDADRGLTIEVRSAAFALQLLGQRVVVVVSGETPIATVLRAPRRDAPPIWSVSASPAHGASCRWRPWTPMARPRGTGDPRLPTCLPDCRPPQARTCRSAFRSPPPRPGAGAAASNAGGLPSEMRSFFRPRTVRRGLAH